MALAIPMERVALLTLDEVVGAGTGMVYSTEPRRALGQDGTDYFVKGPNPEVVFAELGGCLLASAVGLEVAHVAACLFGDDWYAGSQKVADIGRNVGPWLRPARATNFNALFDCIVVDAWLANDDRNQGNVLGRATENGNVELVFIDFEKSVTLRPNPITTTPTVEPTRLWPRGELGQLLRAQKPILPPAAPMQRIRQLAESPNGIPAVLAEIVDAIGAIGWAENSVETLVWRARRIETIVSEVWEAAS